MLRLTIHLDNLLYTLRLYRLLDHLIDPSIHLREVWSISFSQLIYDRAHPREEVYILTLLVADLLPIGAETIGRLHLPYVTHEAGLQLLGRLYMLRTHLETFQLLQRLTICKR